MANEYAPELLAYTAGLLDGEGCFQASTRRTGSVQCILSIANTHRGVLEEMKAAFGGAIHEHGGCHRPCYIWTLSTGASSRLIPLLMPYLRIKREQAAIFLSLIEMQARPYGKRSRVTDEEKTARRDVLAELRASKRVAS